VRPRHPDVEIGQARPQRQHRVGTFQQHAHPARAVVHPLRVDHLGSGDAERGHDPLQRPLVHRPRTQQRRRRERQRAVDPPQFDQARVALLDDHVRAPGSTACGQPGVTGTERRVTGERKLTAGREDPDPVVGAGGFRRDDERGLGQVRPARELLHLLGGQALSVEDDSNRITEVQLVGEHINLAERALHGIECGMRARRAGGDFLPDGGEFLPRLPRSRILLQAAGMER
jgi:hypothetical protein